MTARRTIMKSRTAILAIAFAALAAGRWAAAHCDTVDGPVVASAKAALAAKDVTPVLRWVQPDRENEIRSAFRETLAVRAKGSDAKNLADRYFFETLVRVHRAGEGAPYTGLKPAGTPVPPAVAHADRSLEDGSVDDLAKAIARQVETGIRERFAKAAEAKKHAADNVEAGRRFVAAYVEYVHYVERLHEDAASKAAHHHPAEAADAHSEHAEHAEHE